MTKRANYSSMLAFFTVSVLTGCTSSETSTDGLVPNTTKAPASEIILASEVQWERLNPARGDKSPQAGTLWGDRRGAVPTGFLAKFVDGFSSPPNSHNATYRAVVISGLVHNDDPEAAHMWMPPGSFWTQPKGEAHITAAMGSTNVAYIEIEEGPYLVHPPDMAFDSGERPVNFDASNIVWLDSPGSTGGPEISFLWGGTRDGQLNGTLVRLPAGFAGALEVPGASFRAVVVQGRTEHQAPGLTGAQVLTPGSSFASTGNVSHQIAARPGEECIIYLRTEGTFNVIATTPED